MESKTRNVLIAKLSENVIIQEAVEFILQELDKAIEDGATSVEVFVDKDYDVAVTLILRVMHGLWVSDMETAGTNVVAGEDGYTQLAVGI